MRIATATITGVAPICFGKPFITMKTKNETHAEYEDRCWMERAHINENGEIYIVPMAFKNSLAEAAKYKPTKVAGGGATTYTKYIEAGVQVLEPMILGKADKCVRRFPHFVPADGKRGGSKRVWKNFPVVDKWGGQVSYYLFEDLISQDVFESTLKDSGAFIGVGSMRPRNNGIFGRFRIDKVEWSKA